MKHVCTLVYRGQRLRALRIHRQRSTQDLTAEGSCRIQVFDICLLGRNIFQDGKQLVLSFGAQEVLGQLNLAGLRGIGRLQELPNRVHVSAIGVIGGHDEHWALRQCPVNQFRARIGHDFVAGLILGLQNLIVLDHLAVLLAYRIVVRHAGGQVRRNH